MNYKSVDEKIKSLIQVCKVTENYRKLTIVGYALISNNIDEIGIKLGIRPRKKESGEKIFHYMEIINTMLSENLGITLFQDEIINLLKIIEIQIIKRDFNIPIQYNKKLFNIYYELRKIDVPNLHESLRSENLSMVSNVNFYSSFFSGNKNSDQKNGAFKTMLLHKIKQKELSLQKELKNSFNKDSFEKAIYLKKLRGTINRNSNDKIRIKSNLKENLNYQKAVEDIIGFCFIGAFILFFLLGFVIIIEAVIYPALTPMLSMLLLIFFGPSALLLAVYWNFFHSGVNI